MASPINVADLPVQQLQEVGKQMEEEIQVLTQSFARLKQASVKFNDNLNTIKTMQGAKEGDTVLVPMTNSLYIPGEMYKKDTFICDIGTGYFVEKDTKQALDFYKRKTDFLKSNLEKLGGTIQQRQKQKSSVMDILTVKMAEIRAKSKEVEATVSA